MFINIWTDGKHIAYLSYSPPTWVKLHTQNIWKARVNILHFFYTTFMCFQGTNSFTFKINAKHAHVMNVKMNWCNFVFFHVSIFVSNYILPLQNSPNPINIKQFKLHKSKYSIDVILLYYYAVMLWFLCKLTYPNITKFHQNLYTIK